MEHQKNRVVTYLSEKYKNMLQSICMDREEKEATIVREIVKKFLDDLQESKLKNSRTYFKSNNSKT